MGIAHFNLQRMILVVAASLVSLSIVPTAGAHHGGAVEWQNTEIGPITGTATDFVFRFPHVVVYIDVEGESGETDSWAVNTRWTPTILRQEGWSRNSIEPGDTITVMCRPHITDPTVCSMNKIEVNGEELSLDI